MTKLVGIAALLALAVFGAGCTESVEAGDEGESDGEEVVATSEDELRARALDPHTLLATLKSAKEVQTIKARFSLPGWQGYGDNPIAVGCRWSPQRFDMKIQAKVTGGGLLMKNIRIVYETRISPQSLYVYDSVTDAGLARPFNEFISDGRLNSRDPGDNDRTVVNTVFKPQANNGEGIIVHFNIADSLTDTGDPKCARTAYVAFRVKK